MFLLATLMVLNAYNNKTSSNYASYSHSVYDHKYKVPCRLEWSARLWIHSYPSREYEKSQAGISTNIQDVLETKGARTAPDHDDDTGEGDDRGWDGWMASPTRWTWVWVNPGSWWWTGRPGVLRFMGSQCMGLFAPLELDWLFPFHFGKIFNYNIFKNFLILFLFSSSSGTPIIRMLVHLILFQRSLRLSSVLFIYFTLFCSLEVISTILSSSSLIHSSASDILLLIPSRVFLISVKLCCFLCMFILEFF